MFPSGSKRHPQNPKHMAGFKGHQPSPLRTQSSKKLLPDPRVLDRQAPANGAHCREKSGIHCATGLRTIPPIPARRLGSQRQNGLNGFYSNKQVSGGTQSTTCNLHPKEGPFLQNITTVPPQRKKNKKNTEVLETPTR